MTIKKIMVGAYVSDRRTKYLLRLSCRAFASRRRSASTIAICPQNTCMFQKNFHSYSKRSNFQKQNIKIYSKTLDNKNAQNLLKSLFVLKLQNPKTFTSLAEKCEFTSSSHVSSSRVLESREIKVEKI
jgi:hypothetical protein